MFGYNGEKEEKLNILLFGWGIKKKERIVNLVCINLPSWFY